MRVLAIETSGEACSIALIEDDDIVAHDHRVIGKGHAEMLVPMIAESPDKGRADRIVVSLGPGSFTGIRIGIATARALGVAWRADVMGYPSLALLATAALAKNGADDGVTACINGGHGEWFIQNFSGDGKPQDHVMSLKPEDAANYAKHQILAGNKAGALAEILSASNVIVQSSLANAADVHLLSPCLLTRDLAPIYGRAPDAKPQKAPAA